MQNQYSPNRDSIANTAAMIMANAGWSKPSQATMREIAKANKKAQQEYNAAHKQSFLSSVFDLLQTPLYGVANALDEALAGHQEDDNDSVLKDIAKTAGGVVTGLGRGIGAGLRGASGIVDVLPGIDINDEWQSDPTDKTHFSDVAIRNTVGMATGDAMKPENWDEVKGKLEKVNDKSTFDKTFFELFVPDDLEAQNAREKYFRHQALAGIPVDIGADPLNLVLPGIGGARAATKGITEGLDAARASEGSDAIAAGLNSKTMRDLEIKTRFDAGHAPPVQAIDETVQPGIAANIANVPLNLPKGKVKTVANIGRREEPQTTMLIGSKEQNDLARQIFNIASSGEKGWLYKAADLMRAHPGVTWTETEKLLAKANDVIKKIGPRRGVKGLAPALRERILADVTKKVTEVERRVANAGDAAIGAGVKGGKIVAEGEAVTGLKKSEAILANKVVSKFENEILGRGRAPGTGEGLARAIAGGANVRYSGPQQARMWNQITSSLKYGDASKFDKAVRVLRAVEDYFISKGMKPHSAAKTAESVPLRLSKVIEALGPQSVAKNHAYLTGILRGDPKALAHLAPDEIEVLRALRASEAIEAAPAVQRGITAGQNIAQLLAKTPASAGRKAAAINTAIRDVKTFTAAQGGGDVGAHVVGEYMGNILGKSDPINAVMRINKLKTEAWLGKAALGRGPVNDPEFVRSVTNSIGKAANLPSPAQLGRVAGPAAKVTDWLGARFNAAYGVQDMRPIFLREQASAMSTTGRRAKLLNELARKYPPTDVDIWHEAFRAAQQNGVSSGQVAQLQREIAKVMENLFGGTGLRAGAIADSTVIGRNRLLLDELNKNLKRFGLSKYQFDAGKKVTAADGTIHDFSQGLDWMKSWEIWDVKNPYEFLHQVQNAIEFTVREKNMFDEIISRFASPKKHGDVKYSASHPRLHGYFFTAEGAKQAQVFVRMLEEVSTPNSKALQHFDHVLSKVKAALTIYIPSHHWTNLIGDTYYNWIAGVNKPIRYEQAMKVMLAQKGRYGDFATLEKLTGPKALEQAVARSLVKPDAGLNIPAAGNKVVITMQNGTKVTADMIYTAAFREGILPSARVLEEVASDTTNILDKFRPLGGRGQRAVHTASEVRDHIPRLAQFIDGIAKSKGSFAAASTSSARSVRKWHPDGLDLTKFERNVMKRVFPFYSWTRKAIPLAIEATLFAGPKVMAYPRVMEAIALSNGIDPAQGPTDMFPTDQMFPDWVRDRGIGPIMGGPGSYKVINPSTPILDTLTLLGHPGQSSIDMLNPMVKVPIEVNQGTTLGRSIPIENYSDYAAKQIPGLSQLGRASGQFGVSESTKAEGFPNYANIRNLLFGLKEVNTGKYQKSAQFDLRDYLKQKGEQQGR
jgi:hypothetical protein